MAKEFSKTFLIAAKCMRAAMQILHKNSWMFFNTAKIRPAKESDFVFIS